MHVLYIEGAQLVHDYSKVIQSSQHHSMVSSPPGKQLEDGEPRCASANFKSCHDMEQESAI